MGQVNGFAIEAFGGVKFEPPIGAQHIDRAHFGDHIGRDMDDDLIEANLRADRLGHDLAQTAQQKPRSAAKRTARRHVFVWGPKDLEFVHRQA